MTDIAQSHLKSATWFTLIGVIAAIVHYAVAVSLERFEILTASEANIAGFLMAFPVSFIGHKTYSFPVRQLSSHQLSNHQLSSAKSLVRFFIVAVLGFLANQSLVVINVHTLKLPFWFALGVVMVFVAVSTYLLSRYWAFK